MANDLYKQIIIDHYQHPHNFGKLTGADYSARVFNSFCGDLVEMQIRTGMMNNESRIKDIKFLGSGCAISTASASMLTDYVKGKAVDQISKIGKEKVLELLGIEVSPVRLKCALLPLEALKKAIKWEK